MKVKRGKYDLERDILEWLIFKPQGELATNMLFKVNMSYQQFHIYIKPLINKGYVVKTYFQPTSKKRILRITKEGIDRYIKIRLSLAILKGKDIWGDA